MCLEYGLTLIVNNQVKSKEYADLYEMQWLNNKTDAVN